VKEGTPLLRVDAQPVAEHAALLEQAFAGKHERKGLRGVATLHVDAAYFLNG
jgi:hypothetical protein